MTKATHTPGPWVTDTDGEGKPFAIVTSTHNSDGPDDDVCEVYGGNDDDDAVREANARIIAASPAMLAALKRAADALDEAMTVHIYDADNGDEPDPECEYVATLAEIRAAIAAAEGEA